MKDRSRKSATRKTCKVVGSLRLDTLFAVRGTMTEVETIVASPEAWAARSEASDPSWDPHFHGDVVLAMRLRA